MNHSASKYSNTIGQRLKLEMQKRGLTSAELAKRAEVKTSFIYDVISGKSANPSTVMLARVADGLGISLTQLVEQNTHYQGPSFRMQNDDYVVIPRLAAEISPSGQLVLSAQTDHSPYCFRVTWIKEHLNVSPSNLRLFHVRGDSMEPTLHHNDVMLVDISNQIPAPPGVFIVFDSLGLMPKRLEFVADSKPPRIRVMSDNDQYSTYERLPEEANIIGRVVWFSRAI